MLRRPFKSAAAFLQEDRLDPLAAYALWAATYPARPHNPLMVLEQTTVLSLLPDLGGLTVLDAGCGSGRYLHALRTRGAKLIGLDLSDAMLARARDVTSQLARASICALPIGSMTIDVIVSGLVLGDVPNLSIALAEMARALRPGGCVVYSVVHPVGGERGWSRTFQVDGRQVAIDGYWHTADAHRQACVAAGLRVDAWEQPVLAEAPECPAVFVVRASR